MQGLKFKKLRALQMNIYAFQITTYCRLSHGRRQSIFLNNFFVRSEL